MHCFRAYPTLSSASPNASAEAHPREPVAYPPFPCFPALLSSILHRTQCLNFLSRLLILYLLPCDTYLHEPCMYIQRLNELVVSWFYHLRTSVIILDVSLVGEQSPRIKSSILCIFRSQKGGHTVEHSHITV